MKQIYAFIFFSLSFSIIASAQKTPVTTKKADPSTIQTLKVKPENSYVKPSPDLRLTAVSFSLVNTQIVNGVTTHTFQINYTVKNEGNMAVAANTVFLQGWITYTTPSPRTTAGCGAVITTLAGQMINPGATIANSFRCTASFDKNNPPIYKLVIDSDNLVKESNEDNNMAQTTILF